MVHGSVRVAIGTALVLAVTTGLGGQAPPSGQSQQPGPVQFQSGIEIVLVDVTVLGRGGDPVTTLEPADFTLAVDGRPRKIHSVRLVRSDETPITEAEPTADIVGGPLIPAPRRFIIVIDREHIPAGEGQQMLAAAARFVDSIPAGDRVALWTTAQTTSSIRFGETRESIKQRIKAAVGTYRLSFGPWNIGRDEAINAELQLGSGTFTMVNEFGTESTFSAGLKGIIDRECFRQPQSCPKEVENQAKEIARDARDRADVELANLRALLNAVTPLDGQKHIVLVTGGPVMTFDNTSVVQGIGAQAALARATIHALQLHDPGYQARTDQMRATPERIDPFQSAAYALAGVTGGLATTPVSGDVAFSRLSRELSAGYLLSFETEPADRDGKVHQIDVKVRDRGWGSNVRARKTFRIDPGVPVFVPPAPGVTVPPVAAPVPAAPLLPPEPVGLEPGDMADRLADYAELFERNITAVVAEERFVQIIQPWRGAPGGPDKEPALRWLEPGDKAPRTGPIIARRQLLSDVLMVQAPGQPWQSYRDVAAVDGQPVRDRVDRVQRLFLSNAADRAAGFQQIALESARYNLGDLKRDLNLPTVSLSLLRRGNHSRFEFKRQKDEDVDGRACRVLAYREKVSPTLISTRNSGDVFLYGRVWLEQADGRVRRTELRFDRGVGAGGFRSVIRVDYGPVEGLDILVPVQMWEWYEGVNQLGRIGGDLTGAQGIATYSKFRRFQVSTAEAIKD